MTPRTKATSLFLKRRQSRARITAGLAGALLCLVLCFSCIKEGATGTVTVAGAVSPARATIGETLTYTVTVTADRGIDVDFPAVEKNLGNLEVTGSDTTTSGIIHKTFIRRYRLRSFTAGIYPIPALTITYRPEGSAQGQEKKTVETSVEITGVLGDQYKALDLKDVKGIAAWKTNTMSYLLGAGALLLCALAAFWFLRWRKRKGIPVPAIVPPAHVIAYEALDALRKKDYPAKGLVKEYYTEISLIMRHYLENRFHLRAPEMTTEEFIATVKGSRELTGRQQGLLGDFLVQCDKVKFAKYGPDPSEMEAVFTSSRNIIDQTRQQEEDKVRP